jgi:hypothetical protein
MAGVREKERERERERERTITLQYMPPWFAKSKLLVFQMCHARYKQFFIFYSIPVKAVSCIYHSLSVAESASNTM